MPYTEQGKAIMLWNLAASISHISLHDGPPPEGHEIRGGVYRRMRIDFRDPESGSIRTQREIRIEVPQGARVRYAGFWTSEIGGAMLAWGEAVEHAFRGRGVYVVDLAKLDLNAGE